MLSPDSGTDPGDPVVLAAVRLDATAAGKLV